MNGTCKRMPLLEARSAQIGMFIAGGLGLLNAAGAEALGAVVAAGYLGAALIVGFIWGYCVARKFGRLKVHEESICASGLATNPNRPDFVWFAPFMWDPDYVWDLIPVAEHVHFVFDNASHPRCNDQSIGLLHCEIDSAIKDTGCIGGALGALAGGIIGVSLLVPLMIAALACGPFVWLCAILAFIIAAVAAYVGAYLGALLGHLVGHLIDVISGSADEFASLEANTCISVTGRWAKDQDHGWNEIHPVEFFSPPARDEQGNPLHGDCPNLCPLPPIL